MTPELSILLGGIILGGGLAILGIITCAAQCFRLGKQIWKQHKSL